MESNDPHLFSNVCIITQTNTHRPSFLISSFQSVESTHTEDNQIFPNTIHDFNIKFYQCYEQTLS